MAPLESHDYVLPLAGWSRSRARAATAEGPLPTTHPLSAPPPAIKPTPAGAQLTLTGASDRWRRAAALAQGNDPW